MKKTCKFILSIIILLMLEIILATNKVDAASTATLTGDKTVNKGDTVTVTAQVTAGAWNLTLSGAGKTEGLVGQTSVKANETASKSITFTASEVGTYKITLTGDITDFDTDETIPINKTATITVKEVETKPPTPTPIPNPTPNPEPEKGTLSTFKINGITVKQYLTLTNKDDASIYIKTSNGENATVYNSLTKKSCTVKSDSTVSIQILEGTNTLTITLASGNSYTRKIYSQKEEEVKPNIIEEEPKEEEAKVALKSLLVKGVKSEEEKIELSYTPEFSSEVYEYKMLLDETLADITKLEIEAIGTQEDFTVEITGKDELKEGENEIIITVTSKDGKQKVTYKILVTKEAKVMPVVAPTVEVEQEVIKPLWNRTQQILITVFTSIIAIMGIVFAVIEYRYKKDDEEETEEISFSGIDSEKKEENEKANEEDKVGEIPFAKIGFEKEVEEDKVDILKEEKEEEPEFKDIKTQTEEIEEELKKQAKPKKGKHF